ncbi:MAG: prolyl oligopeptidase family serine peptidase, partial [Candidatus Promineifilaceae bacterium]
MILLIFYCGYSLLVAPLSFWMLLNAQTWVGWGLAVVGFLTILLPLMWAYAYRQRESRKNVGYAARFLTLALVGFLIVVFLNAPSGDPGPDSPVHHRFFREQKFGRFALTNIIPESDQINLGFLVMTYLDPILTAEQARRVSPTTMNLYREMEQDDNFHQLGSVMGLSYAGLFGLSSDVGHYYLYVPQSAENGPLPALVFLHGSVGNFKTYTWVWSKLAEQEGFVIIAPSYGFGNWDAEGAEMVIEAISDAEQVVDIDQERLYLAGLSNGGLGVSRIAAEHPQMFQGLVFISPVFDTGMVDSDSFQENWAGRPILVISGEADNRIPLDYV